jgi:hypothetical protein
MLLVNVASARHTSSMFQSPFISSYFDDTFDNDPFFSSEFDDFDDIFAKMDKEFERFDNMSSAMFKENNEQMAKIRIKLDAIAPVCNTKEDSITSTTEQSKLLQVRPTKTMVCYKELIEGQMKYIYQEVKIMDDQNRVLSQSSGYKSHTINTLNDMSTSRRLD